MPSGCWPGARPGSEVWNSLYFTVREFPFTTCQLIDDDCEVDFNTVTTPSVRVWVALSPTMFSYFPAVIATGVPMRASNDDGSQTNVNPSSTQLNGLSEALCRRPGDTHASCWYCLCAHVDALPAVNVLSTDPVTACAAHGVLVMPAVQDRVAVIATAPLTANEVR